MNRVRKQAPAVLLAVIDILLIAAGVALAYWYLALLPQPYEVVSEPTRFAHPTVTRGAGLPPATLVTRGSAATSTAIPTATATATAIATATAALSPAATPTPRSTATKAPAASAPGTSSSPTSAVSPTALAPPMPSAPPPSALSPTRAASPAASPAAGGAELGGGKFTGKFTDGDVVRTATSYRSANINVTLSKIQRKGVTYYVQDIYVRYIDNLRTAFARNTFGRAIAAWQVDIARANDAVGSINGDYYATGVLRVVIRNGKLYNARPEGDICVLFLDGTMKVYAAKEFDAKQQLAAGAYQAWDFGPGLMTREGKAIGVFQSGIAGYNPRTAIGYYEPGHYAFVVVDGRQPGYSNGMTLSQLAILFEELGCKVAYNLDGGQTAAMTFGGEVVNQPYRGGRPTSDIIYVGE